MKKILFTLFALAGLTNAIADTPAGYVYTPLVREGVKWVEFYENYSDGYERGTVTFQFNGTSVINGVEYNNLYATINNEMIEAGTQPVAYVREHDKRVYALVNDNHGVEFPAGYEPLAMSQCKTDEATSEHILYDFNEPTAAYTNGINYYNQSYGGALNGWHVSYDFHSLADRPAFSIIEGIGTSDEAFINPWPIYPDNGLQFKLAWVEEDGDVIFKGPYYDKSIDSQEEYTALVSNGRKWVYLYYFNIVGSPILEPLYMYSLDIRNDKEVYYTLLDNNFNPVGEPTPVAYILENYNNGDRIIKRQWTVEDIINNPNNPSNPVYSFTPYWYDANENQTNNFSFDIYNFNKVGYLPFSDYIKNSEKTEVVVNGKNCTAYKINEGYYDAAIVIQGLGVDSKTGDLLSPQLALYDSSRKEFMGLVAVYDDDELIYKGCLYDEAMQFSAVNNLECKKQVKIVRYYNLAGVESTEPQPGVNVKVTTYSDGTRSSEKVIK